MRILRLVILELKSGCSGTVIGAHSKSQRLALSWYEATLEAGDVHSKPALLETIGGFVFGVAPIYTFKSI